MKILNNNLKKNPKSFYILCGFVFLLVFYTLFLFFHLKIAGVYGVAIIKEEVATSEGVDITYEFVYQNKEYSGVFTGSKGYKIGDRYFVLFLKSNPNKNLLQYNNPVPDCLIDSIHSFWSNYPKCSKDFFETSDLKQVKKLNDKYLEYVEKLERGITDIDYKDFRESFIESTQFIVAAKKKKIIDSLGNAMFFNINKSNYEQAINAAKQILYIDYSNMMCHEILGQAYGAMNDTINAKKHQAILTGLVNSIMKNGDGKTCKTAWSVIQVSEEDFILRMLGAKVLDIEVGNKSGLCDKFKVEINKVVTIYYFETSKILQGYKKLDS
jgi:hypothetical protein